MDYILKVLDKGMSLPPIMTNDFKNISEYGAYCMLLGYEKAKRQLKEKYKKKYQKKYSSNVPHCTSAER